MDKITASYIAKVAFKCASDVHNLIPIAYKELNEEEFKKINNQLITVGKILTDINIDMLELYPELSEDQDTMINRFGKLP